MSSVKVLIVDDATTFRKLLSMALEGIGITSIIECDSVESAKSELQPGTEIQLIICDWHMPGETGIDLLRWIRSQPHLVNIPFIMLTTEQERGHILEAARVGIQGYIFKPVQKTILIKKLHELGFYNAS
jgi:two-component system chemotaxis response regulator CheY